MKRPNHSKFLQLQHGMMISPSSSKLFIFKAVFILILIKYWGWPRSSNTYLWSTFIVLNVLWETKIYQAGLFSLEPDKKCAYNNYKCLRERILKVRIEKYYRSSAQEHSGTRLWVHWWDKIMQRWGEGKGASHEGNDKYKIKRLERKS